MSVSPARASWRFSFRSSRVFRLPGWSANGVQFRLREHPNTLYFIPVLSVSGTNGLEIPRLMNFLGVDFQDISTGLDSVSTSLYAIAKFNATFSNPLGFGSFPMLI
jgi:hypothetical protein